MSIHLGSSIPFQFPPLGKKYIVQAVKEKTNQLRSFNLKQERRSYRNKIENIEYQPYKSQQRTLSMDLTVSHLHTSQTDLDKSRLLDNLVSDMRDSYCKLSP